VSERVETVSEDGVLNGEIAHNLEKKHQLARKSSPP
jgi:hypothetical protein